MSRPKRWAAAAERCRAAVDELKELQEEYQEWLDGLPENLEASTVAEKLEAVVDLPVDEIECALDEIDGADFPLGFGRD
jgi:phosphoglycolate phosphatase-like HAD superfamily hydrolase